MQLVIAAITIRLKQRLKTICVFLLLLHGAFTCVHAQLQGKPKLDSLFAALHQHKREDSTKANLLIEISGTYYDICLQHQDDITQQTDSILSYARQAIQLAYKLDFKKGLVTAFNIAGNGYYLRADSTSGLDNYRRALAINAQINDKEKEAALLGNIGNLYKITLNYPEALAYYHKALIIYEPMNKKERVVWVLRGIGSVYVSMGQSSKAYVYFEKALSLYMELGDKRNAADMYLLTGNILMNEKKYEESLKKYNASIQILKALKDEKGLAAVYANVAVEYQLMADYPAAIKYYDTSYSLAKKLKDKGSELLYLKDMGHLIMTAPQHVLANLGISPAKRYRTALDYEKRAMDIAVTNKYDEGKLTIWEYMTQAYEKLGDYKSAYTSLVAAVNLRDSLQKLDQQGDVAKKEAQYIYDKKEAAARAAQEKKDALTRLEIQKQKTVRNGLIGGAVLLLLLAMILYNNNRRKQKDKQKIEKAYADLKATQQQLIHSEKMASLGELTAGIAHEIQNPLNFVNNFSELNVELIDEMKAELAAGNTDLANEIADDVKDNSGKINDHGKRADAIVKGMLQHSRSSTGQKEPTDINALCDEYLRLAYHGLRARDKSFNSKFTTDFSPAIRKINVVPQDIGRVILNLLTNAFYAVNEKKQHLAGKAGEMPYDSEVTIKTVAVNFSGIPGIEINISDNGSGIPQPVIEKIFQPFFTTKPSGQGTGLGLSMSYDIIKTAGGELNVQSKEGEGTTFTIYLPL
ncbi:ATP-binding protein [Niabella sp.]|uniref:tetratricopeptide repeat-containing sensor histidine kinase n=1 Tax=Niabella sp. TaxID=1962976 RepID=UPI00262641C5|nr:ATP-binding protein [Niabella sp.]